MNRYPDITGCIGNTPLVRLGRFYPPRQGVEVFAKLEYLNPGGSVKDRIALSMIDDAEARGVLRPGGTLIEPTAGNTGIALAMVAAVRGYRCIFVVPERFSQKKQVLMRALGAEIVHTPTKDGVEGAIEKAQELAAQISGAVVLQQFTNPANVAAHYTATGPEIWEQMEGRVDVVVLGAGTGGTFTGVVRYLKERNPDLYAVIVQPYGATLGRGYAGPHKIEGIGIDHIETVPILDESLIDRLVVVRDEEAHHRLEGTGSRRRDARGKFERDRRFRRPPDRRRDRRWPVGRGRWARRHAVPRRIGPVSEQRHLRRL